jgi:hypothetical protein
MTKEQYQETKLAIYENAAAGKLTKAQCNKLLVALEDKKESETVSVDDAKSFLKDLSDSYPDLEDDIEKLTKKLDDMGGDDEGSDDSGDDDKGSDDGDKDVEESVRDLMDLLKDL